MMYKYANHLLPPVINGLYNSNSDVHNYTTIQKHLLHANKSNINAYSNSFGNTIALHAYGMLFSSKTENTKFNLNIHNLNILLCIMYFCLLYSSR